ncbi:myeloid zinc finger 1 [Pseudoliparis swirei]|uniref:myeloid zinc finger 1 n=1 Tax=Pseudoliparis swirei TaxID=2059687 RepID=UPI0024BECD3D|nr:myeloid zinc finger 1 [Pseudoliparis swirei]
MDGVLWSSSGLRESFSRSKTAADTLSRLARLIARAGPQRDLEQPGPRDLEQPGPRAACPGCGERPRGASRALPKLHGCASCGREFSLKSTLRLHRCGRELRPGGSPPGAPGPACTAPRGLHQHAGGCAAPHPAGVAGARIPTGDCPPASAGASSRSPPPGPSGTQAALQRHTTHRAEPGSKVKGDGRGGDVKTERSAEVTGDLIKMPASRTKLLDCRSCDLAFRSISKLQLHRKEAHSREKRVLPAPRPARRRRACTYACPVCSKVFFHHLSLRAHCRQHPTCSLSTNPSQSPPVGGATKEPPQHGPHGPGTADEQPARAGPGRPRKAVRAENKAPGPGRCRAEPEEEEEEEEEREFPCPSCAEVFSLQAQLQQHEELHRASVKSRPCSVCSSQVEACGRPGSRRRRPYHCGPCLQGFSALDSFLEHCQEHLRVRVEEDGVGKA